MAEPFPSLARLKALADALYYADPKLRQHLDTVRAIIAALEEPEQSGGVTAELRSWANAATVNGDLMRKAAVVIERQRLQLREAEMASDMTADKGGETAREEAAGVADHLEALLECSKRSQNFTLCRMDVEFLAKLARRAAQDSDSAIRKAALEEAARIADKRNKACLKTAAQFAAKRPHDDYWAPSERCAALEASHIADLIRALSSEKREDGSE